MNEMRRADARPLYVQVEAILNGRIADGLWPPGHALPAEPELAVELGVSHGTLRKALDRLERRHLVERHQGRGTFVTQQTSAQALGQFFRVRDRAGRAVTPETLATRLETAPATAEEAGALGLAPGEAVHRIDRVRLIGGKPRILERIVLPAAIFPGFSLPLAPKRLPEEIYVYYQRTQGVTILRAEENLGARAATAEEALALEGVPGTPLLVIERVAFDAAGRRVEWRTSLLDTRDHRYALELE